jgi:invasion protein IalB
VAFVASPAPALMQGRQNHSTAYWTVPGSTDNITAEACAMSWQQINNRAIYLVAIGRWF